MMLIADPVWKRRITGGVLTWLVPFLVSIPFYGRDGVLSVDYGLFKSVMIVTGSVTAALVLIWFFRVVGKEYTREAVFTGVTWLLINWFLDLLVIVAGLGMSLTDYVTRIGLGYLMIPIIVIAAGVIADEARDRKGNS